MSSNDTTKKRKVTTNNNSNRCEGRTSSVMAGVEDIIEEMKANMTRMQNEIDELKKTSNSLTKDNKFLKARCVSNILHLIFPGAIGMSAVLTQTILQEWKSF